MPIEVLLSVFAPIIGALVGVIKRPKISVVYHLLAFAGGIMLAISFLDLIPESTSTGNFQICIFGMVAGFFIMYLVHLTIPTGPSIKETASFLAIGMAIHNLAEGIAVGIATHMNSKLSFIVVSGIFIHDFAEGLCTASPLYYSSKQQIKTFIITALTALPFLLGYYYISWIFKYITPYALSFLLALVAGLMMNITLVELVPESAHKKTGYATEFSLMAGLIVVLILMYLE